MEKHSEIAIVVGGFNNVGLATALRLIKNGLIVAICDFEESTLTSIQNQLGETQGAVRYYQTDISHPSPVKELIDQIVIDCGAPDQLIICSDKAPAGSILTADDKQFDQALFENIRNSYQYCKYGALAMVEAKKGGSIVLVADSLNDGDGQNQQLSIGGDACCGSLERMAKTLAADLGSHQIRVNAVRGQTKTPHERLPEIPLNHKGTADDVASVAVFLASNKASFITGAIVPVDGGLGVVR